jgi:5,5'-dehydrodivanillate O-demethylase
VDTSKKNRALQFGEATLISPEQNESWTRVGRGTPAGEMLRRYWWPVGFSQLVKDKPVPVRLLGEDLILFRDGSDHLGLLDRRCPHRGASLALGRVESDGIRCCYHGWKFAADGRCLDMPAEPAGTPLLDEVQQTAYLAQEISGFVFAYIGPTPAPLLPRYDLLVREDCNRVIGAKFDHCNWLQRAENGYDPAHLGILHAAGYPQIAFKRPEVTRQLTWYGFRTTSQFPNSLEKVSHQVFPSHSRRVGSRVGDQPRHYMHFRVPIDDTLTATFSLSAEIAKEGPYTLVCRGWRENQRGVYETAEDGMWRIASEDQDRAAQESQGLIADRSREFLGTSDSGIVHYRRLLAESIRAVAEGRDPIGIIRDPEKNTFLRFDATMNFSDGKNKAPEILNA